jgi:Methyltransferase domain
MTKYNKSNPLEEFFDKQKEGRGIWKWRHYFEIYERHFQTFRGQPVHFLEIGVYSGGSLSMWAEYFGSEARIYGVDTEPACKHYETETTKVFIGDQSDRNFWKRFRDSVPVLDIVVDDGGHTPMQQTVSLQELLPHLRPGGIYLCEDITGNANEFASHVHEFAHQLNAFDNVTQNLDDNERRLVSKSTELQSAMHSVHLYPFVAVIEKRRTPLIELVAPKHGTKWEPFLE